MARIKNSNAGEPGPWMGKIPEGEFDMVDNPDGCVYYDKMGAYERGESGRLFSEGPGTPKGTGSASGMGKVLRVKS